MSYEPTNWKAGDTITSAKLNKIEQGIGGAVSFVHMITEEREAENNGSIEGTRVKLIDSGDSGSNNSTITIVKLDKTYTEIVEAMNNGLVLCPIDYGYDDIIQMTIGMCGGYASNQNNTYMIVIVDYAGDRLFTFRSETADGELISTDSLADFTNAGDIDQPIQDPAINA